MKKIKTPIALVIILAVAVISVIAGQLFVMAKEQEFTSYEATATVQEPEATEETVEETGLSLDGDLTYVIEVPTDMKLTLNGSSVESKYVTESDVEASNFWDNEGRDFVPTVDVYTIEGLSEEPEAESGYALLEDQITGNYLYGEEVTDSTTLNKIISDAETMASYPAQDASLSEVSAIADTSSTWYKRYSTIPNYWFTSHSVHEFSNQEVLKAIQQSDDTMVAHVIFDYYASNSDVERTWHCGYQLTYHLVDDTWKVVGIETNSLLNPAQEH